MASTRTTAVAAANSRGTPPTSSTTPPTSAQREAAWKPIADDPAITASRGITTTAYGTMRRGAPRSMATTGRRRSGSTGASTASVATAATIRSGYSQTPLNVVGATRATKAPPSAPPIDITR